MVELKPNRLYLWSLCGLFLVYNLQQVNATSCYDTYGRPVRCDPEFVNAAYNKTVIASNTCGSVETEYCLQTNRHSDYEICDVCSIARPEKSHPPEFMNDYRNTAGLTWWQSDTMEYSIQYPNSVNITVHLGRLNAPYMTLKIEKKKS